ADVHMAVLDIRRRKSMIHDHSDPNTRSAGSFFVNPIMTIEEYSAFEDAIARHIPAGERIPAHQLSDGRIKVPAAWLIEHAGYTRGHQCGNVGLSSKHTLALVNYGHATAEEIIALAKEIRDRVQEIFGITLMHEPTFVGVSFN
ncbi:MAG TPA: UDP-N-acetylenolpyruvoylglucosamine reductase, partial [Armatimonadota bacterium]|nr:UDP-N-acetylenolpyruvoylglucosamine reductase [Armatimonadota bacterium]HEX2950333.1 UDP-N-acetylenolpyruvoylglucosamine reductase [Armatimonadota bacterium]